jgi:hypothetical protein
MGLLADRGSWSGEMGREAATRPERIINIQA